MRRGLSGFLVVLGCVLPACVGDAPIAGDAGKMTGEEGGPCFNDGTCKSGLVCVVPNLCAKPDAGGGTDGGQQDSSADGSTADGGDGGLPCLSNALAYWSGNNTPNDFFSALNLSNTGATYVMAMVNQGFQFGGGYLKTPNTTTLGGLQNFTVEFWIKYAQSAIVRSVLDYSFNQQNIWLVIISPNVDFLNFGINNVGSIGIQVPADQTLHHVAFTLTAGTTIHGYVDGVDAMASGASGQIPPAMTASYLTIGANTSGMNLFDGVIDELAVYKAALSAQDIKDTFTAKSAGRCRGM